MVSSNCAVCCSKKFKFIVKQEAIGIIGSLTNILGKNTLVGPILFQEYKTNEIIHNFGFTAWIYLQYSLQRKNLKV